jgi:hypothetical protein
LAGISYSIRTLGRDRARERTKEAERERWAISTCFIQNLLLSASSVLPRLSPHHAVSKTFADMAYTTKNYRPTISSHRVLLCRCIIVESQYILGSTGCATDRALWSIVRYPYLQTFPTEDVPARDGTGRMRADLLTNPTGTGTTLRLGKCAFKPDARLASSCWFRAVHPIMYEIAQESLDTGTGRLRQQQESDDAKAFGSVHQSSRPVFI